MHVAYLTCGSQRKVLEVLGWAEQFLNYYTYCYSKYLKKAPVLRIIMHYLTDDFDFFCSNP